MLPDRPAVADRSATLDGPASAEPSGGPMRTSSRAADLDIVEGTLPLGLPYRALGSGPPLVFLRWFTPDHASIGGSMR
ncbi:Uncharacterised protein [Mycobacteroides abscessus subsp. abscessus]|nr:Uncharacterised protein [Mycobacteroides abscessus subsp. abscessus]